MNRLAENAEPAPRGAEAGLTLGALMLWWRVAALNMDFFDEFMDFVVGMVARGAAPIRDARGVESSFSDFLGSLIEGGETGKVRRLFSDQLI